MNQRNGLAHEAKLIWLVDATTYRHQLDSEVRHCKDRYFRLEHFGKHHRYGSHPTRGVRTYSAGLLRVGSILSASGYPVRYLSLDEAATSLEELDAGVERPAVLGFGAVCPTVPACARVARLARRRLPGVRIVLGGSHAVVAPMLTLKVFGDAFDEVVDGFEADAAARLAAVPLRALRLPPERLDYALLPHPVPEYALNLTTATGCPYRCTYCQDRLVPREATSLDGGLGRIMHLLDRRTPVHFSDSVLGGGPQRAVEVCRALADLDHQMLLSCDLRPELVRKELAGALEAGGFREVRIGLDSADEEVLAAAQRRATPTQLSMVLSTIREHSDLYVSVYLVTGLPGTTAASLDRNVAIVEQLLESGLVDQIRHHLYVPYPTDLCPVGDPRVRLHTDDWSRYDRNSYPVYELQHLTADQLWEAFQRMEGTIVRSWARRLGLEVGEIDLLPSYPDYHAVSYDLDASTTERVSSP